MARRRRRRNMSGQGPRRRRRRDGGEGGAMRAAAGMSRRQFGRIGRQGTRMQERAQRRHFRQTTPYAQGYWDDERGWVSEYAPQIQGGLDRALSGVYGTGGLQDAAMSGLQTPYGTMYANAPTRLGMEGMDRYRQNMSDSVYNQFMRRMEPEFKQRMGDFEQMAAERGWSPGSEIYEKEKSRMEKDWQDTKDQARDRAWQLGSQEAQQMYGLSDEMRNAYLGEQMQQRYGGFQDLGYAMPYTQGPAMGLQGPGSAPNTMGYMASMFPTLSQGYWTGAQLAQRGAGGAPRDPWEQYALRIRYAQEMRDRGLDTQPPPVLDYDYY